jgi:predicted CXXCH cytochrome family protein
VSLAAISALAWLALAPARATLRQDVASSASSTDIDAVRCAGCHAPIVESYSRSGMARALGRIVRGELRDLNEVPAGDTGYRYLLEESGPESAGQRAWMTELWRPPGDPEREPVRSSVPLDFAVGAGILDRSFAARAHGRWWFAPLEVLSAHGEEPRRAALAPGHAVQPLARFTNPIGDECLMCHTDRLPPPVYPRNLATQESAEWSPRGISCAACHAGAEAHAGWRERELSGEHPEGMDPILRGSALSIEQRVSVCARCHLQGDARVRLRAERGLPPPGEDLLEHFAVFLPQQDDGEIAFVSQVERMVASVCSSTSLAEGRTPLSCETCHDPHRSLSDPREREQVRAACLRCHASAPDGERSGCTLPREERGAKDCAECHMRRTGVFDVAHVEITDHLIARKPPAPRRTETPRILHTTDGRLAAFAWPGRERPRYADDPGLALMAALTVRAPEIARPLIDREPSEFARGLAAFQHSRAVALEGFGRLEDAERAYREALRIEPDSPDSAVNLSLLLGRSGRAAEGVSLLDDVLERHPAADNALRNRALLKLELRDPAGFAADLESAHRLRPDAALARSLASYFAQRGEQERSRELYAEAYRLAPHESGR